MQIGSEKTEPHAGLCLQIQLHSNYESTNVDLWMDEYKDLQSWADAFAASGAEEVRAAISAVLVTFRDASSLRDELVQVRRVAAGKLCLAIAMEPGILDEELAEQMQEMGFEGIDASLQGRDEHGEELGFDRIRTALQVEAFDQRDVQGGIDSGGEEESESGRERDEEEQGEEEEAGDLESTVRYLQQVRAANEHILPAERKQKAAEAVRRVMKRW